MPNVFFNIKVTAPAITNDVRVSIYNVNDQNTPIASQQQNTPHLDQQFSFPGLPPVNMIYKVYETAINGSAIISLLGQANFVPANQTISYTAPRLIQVGSTLIPGTNTVWPANVSTVTIPEWIGEKFEIYGRPGPSFPNKDDGILSIDSQFDSTTGKLDLLNIGDVFQPGEFWYFVFQPKIQDSSGGMGNPSMGGAGFSDILLVTTNTTLTVSDLGKKILIQPSGNYLEITLPDYTSAPANLITYFEFYDSVTVKCAKIKTASGQTIRWLGGMTEVYACPSESFELYKRVIPTTPATYEWRVQNACGYFTEVGEFVFSDTPLNNTYNLVRCDGGNYDYQQYARLYAWLLNNGQAIAYSAWNSGNIFMRVKFSLKDSASNNFRVADLQTTPAYLRPGITATDWVSQKILQHQHLIPIGTVADAIGFGHQRDKQTTAEYNGTGSNYRDLTSRATQFNAATGLWEIVDGNENNPNSRSTFIYIKC